MEKKDYLERHEVLDHGFVELVDILGSDQSIVDAARTSYDKGTSKVSNTRNLLRYLLRHKHMGPFEFGECIFRIKTPLFVARQWFRHRTGSYNEVSLRYSEATEDYYVPDSDKITSQDLHNKQARTQEQIEDAEQIRKALDDEAAQIMKNYNMYLEKGVAREIARINIPLSHYTMYVFKMDIRNLLNFLTLRYDDHAQYEIRVYAIAMYEMIKKYFPITMEAWVDYNKEAISLSRVELTLLSEILSDSGIDMIKKITEKISSNKELSKTESADFLNKIKKIA